jgi:hypothetical protein
MLEKSISQRLCTFCIFLQLKDDPAAAGVVIEGAVALRQKMTQHLLL